MENRRPSFLHGNAHVRDTWSRCSGGRRDRDTRHTVNGCGHVRHPYRCVRKSGASDRDLDSPHEYGERARPHTHRGYRKCRRSRLAIIGKRSARNIGLKVIVDE